MRETGTEVSTTQHDGWIGVDLDGTLAHYEGYQGPDHISPPIEKMVNRVKQWLKDGYEVRIFTAPAFPMNRTIRKRTTSSKIGAHNT